MEGAGYGNYSRRRDLAWEVRGGFCGDMMFELNPKGELG